MNIKPIIYNYLITIANGSIYFHAFSYQYPGSWDESYQELVNVCKSGSEIWIQGLDGVKPSAWIHGNVEGEK